MAAARGLRRERRPESFVRDARLFLDEREQDFVVVFGEHLRQRDADVGVVPAPGGEAGGPCPEVVCSPDGDDGRAQPLRDRAERAPVVCAGTVDLDAGEFAQRKNQVAGEKDAVGDDYAGFVKGLRRTVRHEGAGSAQPMRSAPRIARQPPILHEGAARDGKCNEAPAREPPVTLVTTCL